MFMQEKISLKRLMAPCAAFFVAAVILGGPLPAGAVADVPYFADSNVEPNVFLALDTSGSMTTRDIPHAPGQACVVGNGCGGPSGGNPPPCRCRADVMREVLSGFEGANDNSDSGTSIIDIFGAQVRFAVGRFSGGGTGSVDGLSFSPQAGSIHSVQFRNDNLGQMKQLIRNTPTNDWTPTASHLLDVGCWIIGEEGMNDGFKRLATNELASPPIKHPVMKLKPPLLWGTFTYPEFTYEEMELGKFDWTTGFNHAGPTINWADVEAPMGAPNNSYICRDDYKDAHVRATQLEKGSGANKATIPADPAFRCRQTFIVYLTDGEQSVGYGQTAQPARQELPQWDVDYIGRCAAIRGDRIFNMDYVASCNTPANLTTAVSGATIPTTAIFRSTTTSGTNYQGRWVVFTGGNASSAPNRWIARQITGYNTGTKEMTFASPWPALPQPNDPFVIVTQNSEAGRLLLPCIYSYNLDCRIASCTTNQWFNSPVQVKRRGWLQNRVGQDRRLVYTLDGLVDVPGRSGWVGAATTCNANTSTFVENWGPGVRTVLSALRQSTYLPAGKLRQATHNLDPNPGPGIMTYVVGLVAPTNAPLKIANDVAARFGGTDATPTDPEKCLQMNDDGGEAYTAYSAQELTDALTKAIQCIIKGSYTRAAPAFVVSGAGFSSSQEVNAYFEITADSVWWMGHLVTYKFSELARASQTNTAPIPDFDAGQVLTNRATSDPRDLYISLNPIHIPTAVNPANKALGSQIGEPVNPAIDPSKFIPFTVDNKTQIQPLLGGATVAETETVIEFLRDEDGPGGTDIKFEDGSVKTWALGPIVNSTPVIVEAPFFDPFIGGNNAKYVDFINNNEIRPTIVYVGANDGFLHGFVLEDPLAGIKSNTLKPGHEMFGFMPREAARRMKESMRGVVFSVDGQVTVSNVQFLGNDVTSEDDDTFHTVLIGGLRGGGFSYYALDVTDPTSPSFLWEVSHPNMARTFSRPNISRFRVVNNPVDDASVVVSRWLFAVGGGFNAARTDDNDAFLVNPGDCGYYTSTDTTCWANAGKTIVNPAPTTTDPINPAYPAQCPGGATPEGLCVNGVDNTIIVSPQPPAPGLPDLGQQDVGNWVFIFDIERGILYQNIRVPDLPAAQDPRFNSVPGEMLLLDRTDNGFVDNILLGDIEGRLWKIVVSDPDPVKWRKDLNNNGGLDGDDSPCLMFDPLMPNIFNPAPGWMAELKRRPIFYAPAATEDCNGDINLFFGTGDLAQPNDITNWDYLYALKDRNRKGCGTLDGGDAALVDFECPADSGYFGVSDETEAKVAQMFPLRLRYKGEKILSSPVIFNGDMFITTFIPELALPSDLQSVDGCSSGKSSVIKAPAVCCHPKILTGQDDLLQYEEPGALLPPPVRTPQGTVASPSAIQVLQGNELPPPLEEFHKQVPARWFNVIGQEFIP